MHDTNSKKSNQETLNQITKLQNDLKNFQNKVFTTSVENIKDSRKEVEVNLIITKNINGDKYSYTVAVQDRGISDENKVDPLLNNNNNNNIIATISLPIENEWKKSIISGKEKYYQVGEGDFSLFMMSNEIFKQESQESKEDTKIMLNGSNIELKSNDGKSYKVKLATFSVKMQEEQKADEIKEVQGIIKASTEEVKIKEEVEEIPLNIKEEKREKVKRKIEDDIQPNNQDIKKRKINNIEEEENKEIDITLITKNIVSDTGRDSHLSDRKNNTSTGQSNNIEQSNNTGQGNAINTVSTVQSNNTPTGGKSNNTGQVNPINTNEQKPVVTQDSDTSDTEQDSDTEQSNKNSSEEKKVEPVVAVVEKKDYTIYGDSIHHNFLKLIDPDNERIKFQAFYYKNPMYQEWKGKSDSGKECPDIKNQNNSSRRSVDVENFTQIIQELLAPMTSDDKEMIEKIKKDETLTNEEKKYLGNIIKHVNKIAKQNLELDSSLLTTLNGISFKNNVKKIQKEGSESVALKHLNKKLTPEVKKYLNYENTFIPDNNRQLNIKPNHNINDNKQETLKYKSQFAEKLNKELSIFSRDEQDIKFIKNNTVYNNFNKETPLKLLFVKPFLFSPMKRVMSRIKNSSLNEEFNKYKEKEIKNNMYYTLIGNNSVSGKEQAHNRVSGTKEAQSIIDTAYDKMQKQTLGTKLLNIVGLKKDPLISAGESMSKDDLLYNFLIKKGAVLKGDKGNVRSIHIGEISIRFRPIKVNPEDLKKGEFTDISGNDMDGDSISINSNSSINSKSYDGKQKAFIKEGKNFNTGYQPHNLLDLDNISAIGTETNNNNNKSVIRTETNNNNREEYYESVQRTETNNNNSNRSYTK